MSAADSPIAARLGVAAAVLSIALGGMALACSRFVIGATDAVALGAWRYCVGFVCLLAMTLAVRGRWPPRADWAGVALLGLLFFAIFPVLYNLSIAYPTAARASLALSTLPLLTMVAAAALGIEKLTWRKSTGVAIAVAGVAAALAAGLAEAPAGAWRGDLLMVAGASLERTTPTGSPPRSRSIRSAPRCSPRSSWASRSGSISCSASRRYSPASGLPRPSGVPRSNVKKRAGPRPCS